MNLTTFDNGICVRVVQSKYKDNKLTLLTFTPIAMFTISINIVLMQPETRHVTSLILAVFFFSR